MCQQWSKLVHEISVNFCALATQTLTNTYILISLLLKYTITRVGVCRGASLASIMQFLNGFAVNVRLINGVPFVTIGLHLCPLFCAATLG